MSFTVTREPIPARFVGDANSHTVILKIAVRAGMGQDLPTKRELENKIASDLLHMKRLDEGAAWDVASVIIPDPPDVQQIMTLLNKLDAHFSLADATYDKKMSDQLWMLKQTIMELLGLEDA